MLVVVALAVATGGTARAVTYYYFNFSFSGTSVARGSETASGTLTTTLVSGNEYLIQAISGTTNGDAITSLAPVGFSDSNDNLLYYPAGGLNPQGNFNLDSHGFLYYAGVFGYKPEYTNYTDPDTSSSVTGYYDAFNGIPITSFNVTMVPGPIPGTGALSYLIVLLGGAWRWRTMLFARARYAASSTLQRLRALYRGLRPSLARATRTA